MLDKITKNSWNNLEFEWWGRREDKSDKLDYTLIPLEQLTRLAWLYTRGAKIYWEHNWTKSYGSEEYREWMRKSAYRHFIQWMKWETDEDHAMAIVFNVFWFEELTRLNDEDVKLND